MQDLGFTKILLQDLSCHVFCNSPGYLFTLVYIMFNADVTSLITESHSSK